MTLLSPSGTLPLPLTALLGLALPLPIVVELLHAGAQLTVLPFVWAALSAPVLLLLGAVQQTLTARWDDPVSRRCLAFPKLDRHFLAGAVLLAPLVALLWLELGIAGLDSRLSLLSLGLLLPLGWNVWHNPLRDDPEFGWGKKSEQQEAEA